MENKKNMESKVIADPMAETREHITLQIKKCQYDMAMLTKKTDAAEERFKKAERLHHVLEFLAGQDMGSKNEWVEYKRLTVSIKMYNAGQYNIKEARKKIHELAEMEKVLQQCLQ